MSVIIVCDKCFVYYLSYHLFGLLLIDITCTSIVLVIYVKCVDIYFLALVFICVTFSFAPVLCLVYYLNSVLFVIK